MTVTMPPTFPLAETNRAITVTGVCKHYAVYAEPRDLLMETLTGKPRHTSVDALDGVDLEVSRGEVLGVIGRNGSGKSTLLKIISGTLSPSQGTVDIRGKLSAILELGTGFQDDLTGRENIRIGSLYLGMTPEEVDSKRDWIIEFSGLAHAIDQPFKTYSTGMKGRLTFATAVAIDPDILIIDEALATGDAFFVHRCLGRIKEICASGSTVLLVTHGTHLVSQLCDRALWLEDGKVKMLGDSLEVVRAYDYHIHLAVSGEEGELVDVDPETLGAAGIAADPAGKMVAEFPQTATLSQTDTPMPNSAKLVPSKPEEEDAAPEEPPRTPEPIETLPQTTLRSNPDEGEEELHAAITNRKTAHEANSIHQLRNDRDAFENKSLDIDEDLSPALVQKEPQKVFRRGPIVIDQVEFLNEEDKPSSVFLTDRVMTIRVHYSCKGNLPKDTLGLAVGIQREADLELICQFSTCNVRRDEELRNYDDAPYRTRPGRNGTIEARLDPIQMASGTYIVSVGIIPNRPNETTFYEYHHMMYKLEIQRDGFPFGAVYYPSVVWRHEPL